MRRVLIFRVNEDARIRAELQVRTINVPPLFSLTRNAFNSVIENSKALRKRCVIRNIRIHIGMIVLLYVNIFRCYFNSSHSVNSHTVHVIQF